MKIQFPYYFTRVRLFRLMITSFFFSDNFDAQIQNPRSKTNKLLNRMIDDNKCLIKNLIFFAQNVVSILTPFDSDGSSNHFFQITHT